MSDQKLLEKAVKNKDVKQLCKAFFGVELYPTQVEIVKDIAFQRERRIVLNCYTQYGKTLAIGVGIALHILLNNKKEIDIGLLGPAKSDARSIRDDMLEYGLNSEDFKNLIDTSKGSSPDDMLKSASKDVVTFNDGSIKVECMSASSGSSGKGEGLMGDGVDILVMDESNRISHDVWKDSADRLLNEFDSVLVEAGNPKHQSNQFHEHWRDPKFRKYHVGEKSLHEYEDAYKPSNLHTASGIEEGRHKKAFFDEKAQNVGGRDSVRYSWKYKSVFPDQIEGGLVSQAWIREAQDNSFEFKDPEIRYALDVADEGDDLIVLTRLEKEGGQYRLTDQWSKKMSSDTKRTAQWADRHIEEASNDIQQLVVDYTGIGGGVWSKLNEMGYPAEKFKAGEKPEAEEDKYLNKKARNFFKLRNVLQDGDLDLVDGFENNNLSMPDNKLLYQISHMKREPGRRDKDKVVDPDNKSPDFADSAMMCFFEGSKAFVM